MSTKWTSAILGFALVASGACSTDSDGEGDESEPSFCYQANDGTRCTCHGGDRSSEYPASLFTKVAACSLAAPVCCADTDTAGLTSECRCYAQPRVCRQYEYSCECPGDYGFADGAVVSTCTPTSDQTCCLQDDGECTCTHDQFPGEGCSGEGGMPVASCSPPTSTYAICASAEIERASCSGLTWQ